MVESLAGGGNRSRREKANLVHSCKKDGAKRKTRDHRECGFRICVIEKSWKSKCPVRLSVKVQGITKAIQSTSVWVEESAKKPKVKKLKKNRYFKDARSNQNGL